MKTTLKTGVTETRSFELDTARTIGFMGDELRVYATPSMVNDLEMLCRDLLVHHADPQEDSVGARVEIDHLAPTVIGQQVTVRATVLELELPRVIFEVEISDEVEVVGRALHVRFVVDKARQGGRLAKKAQRWRDLKAGGAPSR